MSPENRESAMSAGVRGCQDLAERVDRRPRLFRETWFRARRLTLLFQFNQRLSFTKNPNRGAKAKKREELESLHLLPGGVQFEQTLHLFQDRPNTHQNQQHHQQEVYKRRREKKSQHNSRLKQWKRARAKEKDLTFRRTSTTRQRIL